VSIEKPSNLSQALGNLECNMGSTTFGDAGSMYHKIRIKTASQLCCIYVAQSHLTREKHMRVSARV